MHPCVALMTAGLDFAVFGQDYETPDGTAVRDYIHVSDLAHAHVKALACLREGYAGDSFNVGTGTVYSVGEVLLMIEHETGHSVPRTMKPRRAGDPSTLVANASAVYRALGFRAVHSDLTSIVKTAWRWHQKAHPARLNGNRQADKA
jgi:UDP-glucose 4-epimerase